VGSPSGSASTLGMTRDQAATMSLIRPVRVVSTPFLSRFSPWREDFGRRVGDCRLRFSKRIPNREAQGWEHRRLATNHYRFVNQHSGLCLDAFDGAFNGARLLQGTCKAISNEEFNTGTQLPARTKIEARPGFRDTGFCLDVLSDQTNVAFWQCGSPPTEAQTWVIPGADQ
jgi:hypothetical protein